jgi:hypothetical protein
MQKTVLTSSIVNHKPNHSEGTRSTRITTRNATQSDLSITDQDDGEISNYKYAGQRGSTKNSYVLIFDQAKQTCTLEPLTSSYTFNITSTPWETSSAKLAQQYTQLQAKAEDLANGTNGDLDEDPDGEADADNPYDFRHYLISAIRGPSPSPSPALRAINTGTDTPQPILSRPTGTPEVKPRKKAAAKAYDPLRANQRKPKSAAPAANKAKPKPTPTIKLDRRASTRPGDEDKKGPKLGKGNAKSDYYVHSSDDDEEPPTSQPVHSDIEEEDEESGARGGGLEIDFGDDLPPKKKSKALAFKRAGPPISLHSAVNSPDSRVITPRHQQKKNDPQEVIDFGDSTEGYEEDDDSDTEDFTQQKHKQDHDVDMHDADADADADADMDADADADEDEHDDDIEPMTLGSPAHQQPPTADEDDDDGDLDADFEAEMLQAMQGDDDAEVAEDSEEESEAE